MITEDIFPNDSGNKLLLHPFDLPPECSHHEALKQGDLPCEEIPEIDNNCSDEFGKKIVHMQIFSAQPYDQNVQPDSDDTDNQKNRKLQPFITDLSPVEDPRHTEQIIRHQPEEK